MLNRLSHTRLLRAAGLYTWALVGIPIILNIFLPPSRGVDDLHGLEGLGVNVPMTALAYLTFGLCYWLATRALGLRAAGGSTQANFALLLAMTIAAVAVGYYTQTGLSAMLLLVMAGVLPWILSLRAAVIWLLLAHIPLVPSFMARDDFGFWDALFQSTFYVGFSAFVLVTAYVARQQAQAREEQRRLNAELRATRMLLAESARVNERTRISRELHDLLGHHLTALSLNLEVAGHLAEGRALEHIKQAHALARLLLTDVREVVSQLREGDAIDLGAALLLLTERVPALAIHMEIEEPLTLEDAERAHVLLRCTQEIITNTVRHADARNLWIHCRRDGGQIVIDARDDGLGAQSVVAGNGLRGMRERLRQHGGNMTIESRSGAGFRLCLQLPVDTTEPFALEPYPEPLIGDAA
ncbi:MAG: sensor histidine kinase [Pseudoxanthomonas sp.]